MENKLNRKFGLLMAMCMVVGTVIGSGIFFRNEQIITIAGGRMWVGIAAWVGGGLITLSGAYVIAVLASRHERVGGLVDYSEAMVSKPYGYVLGWFMATMFYPSMTGILAWVTARFTVELFGFHTEHGVNSFFSGETYAIALFYLAMIFTINGLSPKISEKLQVSGTFIKVVPLILMGVIGLVAGLINGVTVENLNFNALETVTGIGGRVIGGYAGSSAFFYALTATVFAYVGWDCVTNLNSEIRNSKRNLPIAMVAGMLIIITIYTLYFVGIFSATNVEVTGAAGGTREAFTTLFSPVAGTVLFVFIVISCLGTLNGLTVAAQRAFYNLAARDSGPKPTVFKQVDAQTNVPNNSTQLAMLCVAGWMVVQAFHLNPTFPAFDFNVTNLIPVAFFALFIPMYVMVIVREKSLGKFNRFVAPVIAILGACFLIFTVIYNEGMATVWFLCVFAVIMGVGLLLRKSRTTASLEGEVEDLVAEIETADLAREPELTTVS